MPIVLVTGLPGHGKTLYTISRYREIAEREGRPVFQRGIKGLKLPWPELDPKEWRSLEKGSILIIDECQDVFPCRGRGDPDEWIRELAKHRHRGIDLVLITQDPMLFDSFVRRLVDQHFHVMRTFGLARATVHEFPTGVRDNVSKSRTGSIRHEWTYPKSVYELYQSAELHTVKRRIPARVWLMLLIPFVLACLVTFVYYRLRPSAVAERVNGAPAAAPGPGGPPGALPGPAGGAPAMPVASYLTAYEPRIAGLPHTAPVYDEVTRPAVAPYPAACVSSGSRCQCYSQQATKLDMPASLCLELVARGFFVNWQQQQGGARPVAELGQVAPAPALPASAH